MMKADCDLQGLGEGDLRLCISNTLGLPRLLVQGAHSE